MKTVLHVVGARPNFMKIAPLVAAVEAHNQRDSARAIRQILVHTGQHYDHAMSRLFFDELGIPRPDINLEVGSGAHGEQTGRIMQVFEPVLLRERPDLVVVVGDVNSTMACTIDAKKLGIPVAHVEAGLRSRDMTMPEEINRLVTDALADHLFTTDREAGENLIREGVPVSRIHFVGNVMIDTLLRHRARALAQPTLTTLGLADGDKIRDYAVLTLHRPGNVDARETLEALGTALARIGERMPVIFPVHPRTRTRIADHDLSELFSLSNGIRLMDPLGYLDFMNLMAHARLVLTDSGGIQEETTILGVPCLTLRPNTERPVTLTQGSNRLVGTDPQAILAAAAEVLAAPRTAGRVPELWDGRAAERIVAVLADFLYPSGSESGQVLRKSG